MEMSTTADPALRPLSALLEEVRTALAAAPRIGVGTLLELFHERGFGFFLFLIALPAALPVPALGINTLIAFPLLLLTAQQMTGRHTVWLPGRWRAKTLPAQKLDGLIARAMPYIAKIEWLVRPRLGFMTQGVFSHLIGLAGFIMALTVTIPVPLTNTVPSFGIACMAIGVLMRDGLAVLGGLAVGLSWCVMLAVLFALFGMEAFDIVRNAIHAYL